MVASFKYLGDITMDLYDDWTKVVGNLRKARKIWACLLRILVKEGGNPRVLGVVFKAVAHAIYLSCAKTLGMTPAWDRPWGGLNTG